MQDPYKVLGISPSATDDEVKKAYRALAKKYHPDVNQGAPEAEARMKEINEAYSTVMKMRREGTSGNYGYSGSGFGGSGFGGSGFGGFGGYGSAGYGASSDPQLQAARNYIRAGYYQEAMNVLEGLQNRSAEWYYLCGEASLGLGNRVAALNYAQQAVSLDPNSFEYRALLSRLQSGGQFYQNRGMDQGFGVPAMFCGDPVSCCMSQLLVNMLCNCCCGFGRGC